MTDLYLRLEDGLRRQSFESVCRWLIGAELVGALILLVAARSDFWDLAVYLVAGAALLAAALALRTRSDVAGKLLAYVGAAPLIAFLWWLFLPLGLVALALYGIVAFVSLVS